MPKLLTSRPFFNVHIASPVKKMQCLTAFLASDDIRLKTLSLLKTPSPWFVNILVPAVLRALVRRPGRGRVRRPLVRRTVRGLSGVRRPLSGPSPPPCSGPSRTRSPPSAAIGDETSLPCAARSSSAREEVSLAHHAPLACPLPGRKPPRRSLSGLRPPLPRAARDESSLLGRRLRQSVSLA